MRIFALTVISFVALSLNPISNACSYSSDFDWNDFNKEEGLPIFKKAFQEALGGLKDGHLKFAPGALAPREIGNICPLTAVPYDFVSEIDKREDITSLDLSQQKISYLDMYPKNIRRLDLSQNNMRNLGRTYESWDRETRRHIKEYGKIVRFSGQYFEKLEYLNVSNNPMEKFPVEDFKHFPNLKEVVLPEGIDKSTIPEEFMKKVKVTFDDSIRME